MTPQTLVAEISSLFALPDVVLRVQILLDKPETNARDISDAVGLDAGLAAAVLHLANSALYGQHGHVDSVARAIDLIGRRALHEMVLATSVVRVFKNIPEDLVDMGTFWDNSITCGVVAQLLAMHVRARDADSLFLAGLLHGIGRLVFYARRPEHYRALLLTRPVGYKAMAAAEQQTFGFTYADLGAALMQEWGLPERLCAAIRHQLHPEATPLAHARDVAILHIANDIAGSLAPCLKSRQPATPYVPGFDPGAGEILAIAGDELETLRLEALARTFDIIAIINPESAQIY